MKYFSLFSGIGGFELGIQNIFQSKKPKYETKNPTSLGQSGMDFKSAIRLRCIGFSEIDKYAIQIYKKHFPTHKEYGDVTNIKWSDVPNFELLVAGFPCQSFSIAGKREGFHDIRGTLFFEIARAAQEKQPRLLLLENVKGLLSHDKGRTFGTILNTLDESGYDLQWQVLNSKNFGVPQNRERVFIVGHLRGTSRPQVFPIRETTTGSIKVRARGKHQQDIVYNPEGILNLPAGTHGSAPHLTKIEMKVANAVTPDAYLASGKRKRVDGKAVLTSMHERRIRRLTPTECERLQGFPDGWTEGISDTQRYKCLGNAVTTNVISAIIERL
uniref:Putative methyltransferase n=1 Tax=viral metagenome TaxID=1070528 RepID=A0A6M3KD86_9ZZZZ